VVKDIVVKLLANIDEVLGVLDDNQKSSLVKTVVEINRLGNELMSESMKRINADEGSSLRFVLRGEKRILQERVREEEGKTIRIKWIDVPFVGKID
jgi:hypothetical protein